MEKKSLIEEIWDSWSWKLREKLTDANDVVCRIHYEYKLASGGRMKTETYETFMKEKFSEMLKEICDEAERG
jgi:hypothetical protein